MLKILLKVALNTINQTKSNRYLTDIFGKFYCKYKHCALTTKTISNFAPLIVFAVIDHANVYFLYIVNGNWGSWGSWNPCTKTCVGGTRTRYRSCNNPTPVNGGSPCSGLNYDTESCSTTILCTGISIICCLA